MLPAQIASYERRQETENARSRDEHDDDDRYEAWREGSAMVLPPDGRRRNTAALERNYPAVVLPHVAETELVGPARLEPADPVAAHVAANVDPPEARRRKTVSGRRGAEVTWWRVT